MNRDYLGKRLRELVGTDPKTQYTLVPCNTHRYYVNGYLNTEKKIKDYIRYARDTKQHGQIMFPVTEKDTHHKLWLTVCKEDKNAQIVETTSHHAGNYKCWLIFYQNNRKAGT